MLIVDIYAYLYDNSLFEQKVTDYFPNLKMFQQKNSMQLNSVATSIWTDRSSNI